MSNTARWCNPTNCLRDVDHFDVEQPLTFVVNQKRFERRQFRAFLRVRRQLPFRGEDRQRPGMFVRADGRRGLSRRIAAYISWKGQCRRIGAPPTAGLPGDWACAVVDDMAVS